MTMVQVPLTLKLMGFISRGVVMGSEVPTGDIELIIGNVSGSQSIAMAQTVTLWASEIVNPDGSEPVVWAEITLPGGSPSQDLIRVDFQFNSLLDRWEGSYTFLESSESGNYFAVVHAESEFGFDQKCPSCSHRNILPNFEFI